MTVHVCYAMDGSGLWLATVDEVSGCHTQGHSMEQVRERIKEALVVCVGDIPITIRERFSSEK